MITLFRLAAFRAAVLRFGNIRCEFGRQNRKTKGKTDPDAAPATPEHPVSRLGDLWILGRHRLLCGDSTVATDVERVLAGVEPHLMVTDPTPYGVNYDPEWRNQVIRENGTRVATRAVGRVENKRTLSRKLGKIYIA